MPNLDAGHYFFTAIVPICNEGIVEHRGMRSSPVHMVREALETLPTALQSEASEKVGIQSPFASSHRTHFARLVVLDQPFYNGRDGSDAILSAIKGTDLLKAQACDALTCPYLLVMLDFDPVDPEAKGEPRAYLEHLWDVMPEALTEIFRYCYCFSSVRDAPGFADFLLPCQVETTMPFNDYWREASPPLKSISLLKLAIPPLIGVLFQVAELIWNFWPWWLAELAAVLLIALGVFIDYKIVMAHGEKPFPTSDASLPQVLKALYLQQAFARFVVERQGADPGTDGAAFKAFLAEHRPRDLVAPTQPPGVVRTRFEGAAS
jgi:hypothetical protein